MNAIISGSGDDVELRGKDSKGDELMIKNTGARMRVHMMVSNPIFYSHEFNYIIFRM